MTEADILIEGANGAKGDRGKDAPNAASPLDPNGKPGKYDKDSSPECISATSGKDGLNASENGGGGVDGIPGEHAFEFIMRCSSFEMEIRSPFSASVVLAEKAVMAGMAETAAMEAMPDSRQKNAVLFL
jgi:hypothetical protein